MDYDDMTVLENPNGTYTVCYLGIPRETFKSRAKAHIFALAFVQLEGGYLGPIEVKDKD